MPRLRCSSLSYVYGPIYSRARGGAAESGAAAHVQDVVVVVVASFSARGAITRRCCGCDCVFPLVASKASATRWLVPSWVNLQVAKYTSLYKSKNGFGKIKSWTILVRTAIFYIIKDNFYCMRAKISCRRASILSCVSRSSRSSTRSAAQFSRSAFCLEHDELLALFLTPRRDATSCSSSIIFLGRVFACVMCINYSHVHRPQPQQTLVYRRTRYLVNGMDGTRYICESEMMEEEVGLGRGNSGGGGNNVEFTSAGSLTSKNANGNIITLTLKNNHLIVETEERASSQRSLGRGVFLHYALLAYVSNVNNTMKEALYARRKVSSIVNIICAEHTARSSSVTMEDTRVGKYQDNGCSVIVEVPPGYQDEASGANNNKIASSAADQQQQQARAYREETSSAARSTSAFDNSKLFGSCNTGLSQSDLSICSEGSANPSYRYGNQLEYEAGHFGYPMYDSAAGAQATSGAAGGGGGCCYEQLIPTTHIASSSSWLEFDKSPDTEKTLLEDSKTPSMEKDMDRNTLDKTIREDLLPMDSGSSIDNHPGNLTDLDDSGNNNANVQSSANPSTGTDNNIASKLELQQSLNKPVITGAIMKDEINLHHQDDTFQEQQRRLGNGTLIPDSTVPITLPLMIIITLVFSDSGVLCTRDFMSEREELNDVLSRGVKRIYAVIFKRCAAASAAAASQDDVLLRLKSAKGRVFILQYFLSPALSHSSSSSSPASFTPCFCRRRRLPLLVSCSRVVGDLQWHFSREPRRVNARAAAGPAQRISGGKVLWRAFTNYNLSGPICFIGSLLRLSRGARACVRSSLEPAAHALIRSARRTFLPGLHPPQNGAADLPPPLASYSVKSNEKRSSLCFRNALKDVRVSFRTCAIIYLYIGSARKRRRKRERASSPLLHSAAAVPTPQSSASCAAASLPPGLYNTHSPKMHPRGLIFAVQRSLVAVRKKIKNTTFVCQSTSISTASPRTIASYLTESKRNGAHSNCAMVASRAQRSQFWAAAVQLQRHPFSPTERRVQQQQQQQYMVIVKKTSGCTARCCVSVFVSREMQKYSTRACGTRAIYSGTGCHTYDYGEEYHNLTELFFKINDEMQQTVQIDARDKWGWTPLQWAVASLKPDVFDVLLDRGADLSSFVFPTEDYFGQWCSQRHEESWPHFKLRLASSVLITVERLEKRGYELERSDAQTIMAFFVNPMSFQSFSLCTEVLRRSRVGVNFQVPSHRRAYLDAILPTICRWKGEYPNLRHIFHPDEIELLLFESIGHELQDYRGDEFIWFAARCGYRDEKVVYGEDGRPTSRRTTPVHVASKREPNFIIVRDLFEIYDRRDVNYTDGDGLTHFHVACKVDLRLVVSAFLDSSLEHVNTLEPESECPPLHLALQLKHVTLAELLIKKGADPNLANVATFTPLHIVCGSLHYLDDESSSIAKLLFDQNEGKVTEVQVDARDLSGNTPLHSALRWSKTKTVKLLLKKGADPNAANDEGSTGLHVVCKSGRWNHELITLIYTYSQHEMLPDIRDELGRTPLQWAVANLATESVCKLLECGARIDEFTFPTEGYFAAKFERRFFRPKLEEVAGVLTIMDTLEAAGYEIEQVDVLAVLIFLVKHNLYDSAPDLNHVWYGNDTFEQEAQEVMFKSASRDILIYDLVQLEPKETCRRFPYMEYFEFAYSGEMSSLTTEHRDLCDAFLCESLINRFCKRWSYKTDLIMAQIKEDLERFKRQEAMKVHKVEF
ncbi:unnamed protein product [Trichogramma brassicae]|uniref:Uncharacterized protein n=1 Tax=Trichogramma brassicae TaxID=86971 RepID=A0A6H5HZ70_9HYME|nr:unnamed protein product [Trichogramma brassicae]